MKEAQAASPWHIPKPMVRGNIAGRILEDLKTQILEGQIAKGTKIPSEKELALRYGVSPPSVRNAMRGLASSGFIEIRHGSGAYVTADPDELISSSLNAVMLRQNVGMADMIHVLSVLNGLAASLCATNATEADIAAMQQALSVIERAKTKESVLAGFTQFLHGLAEGSKNRLLASLCRSMMAVQLSVVQPLGPDGFEVWEKTGRQLGKERRRLLDAIKSRDPERSRTAANAYYARALRLVSEL